MLSYVASGVSDPLQLDPVTAKLEPVPYGMFLVEANAEEPLPNVIDIAILNDDGNTKSYSQSKVKYLNKPSHCPSCKVFGHSLARCPNSSTTLMPEPSRPNQIPVTPQTTPVPSQSQPQPIPSPSNPTPIVTPDVTSTQVLPFRLS